MGADPTVRQFDDLQSLREAAIAVLSTDAYVFVFEGQRHLVSQGALRYLLLANGSREPLFDLPDPAQLTPEPDGFVGLRTEIFEDEEPDETPEEAAGELQDSDGPQLRVRQPPE